MKKCLFSFIVLIAIMAFTVAFASGKPDDHTGFSTNDIKYSHSDISSFDLPMSLEVIEDEAFEGTSITYVNLPETVAVIGDRAFADIAALRSIRIPAATTLIEKTAFAGSNHVTITAAPNSYVRTWAKENRLPFSPLTVMYAGTGGQNVTGALSSGPEEVPDTESSETEDANRTWKKLEEKPIQDTIIIIANHVQGRAPPMA